MKELSLEEAALAWAQGKMVEASPELTDNWGLIYPVGSREGQYNPKVFSGCPKYRFRLTPEPPAKKWRPWTPEEVPVGAIVRTARADQPFRWLIVAVCSDGITTCGGKSVVTQSCDLIMQTCEHSLDGGKTWLPCGVEVDA